MVKQRPSFELVVEQNETVTKLAEIKHRMKVPDVIQFARTSK